MCAGALALIRVKRRNRRRRRDFEPRRIDHAKNRIARPWLHQIAGIVQSLGDDTCKGRPNDGSVRERVCRAACALRLRQCGVGFPQFTLGVLHFLAGRDTAFEQSRNPRGRRLGVFDSRLRLLDGGFARGRARSQGRNLEADQQVAGPDAVAFRARQFSDARRFRRRHDELGARRRRHDAGRPR